MRVSLHTQLVVSSFWLLASIAHAQAGEINEAGAEIGTEASVPEASIEEGSATEAVEDTPVAQEPVAKKQEPVAKETAEKDAATDAQKPTSAPIMEATTKTEAPASAATPASATAPSAAEGPAADPAALGKAYDFISDGSRITLTDKDITIVPPKGWEIYTTHPSLSLLMQVPHQPGMKYQRTVQLAAFSGPKFLDEQTAKEYEQIIVKKFSEASSSISDFHIRNHQAVEMADGRQGLLFYSDFQLDGVNLMQSHILVSSTKQHYLITYTDLAEHFENESKTQNLTEAWEAMISMELEGRSPARFESIMIVGSAAGLIVILGIAGWFWTRWRAGRQFAAYAAGQGLDDVDLNTQEPSTLTSDFAVSQMGTTGSEPLSKHASSHSAVSGMSDFKSMKKSMKTKKKDSRKASKNKKNDYNTTDLDDEDIAV